MHNNNEKFNGKGQFGGYAMCVHAKAIICAHAQIKWKMKGAKEAMKIMGVESKREER